MNTKKRRYRINKFRMFSALFVITAVIIASIVCVHGFISNAEEAAYTENLCTEYKMIEVAQGDSLWSIAQSCNIKGTDLRKTVEKICDINMLENCMIYPGEILMIPNA